MVYARRTTNIHEYTNGISLKYIRLSVTQNSRIMKTFELKKNIIINILLVPYINYYFIDHYIIFHAFILFYIF